MSLVKGFVHVSSERVMPMKDCDRRRTGRPPLYPWRTMQVGQSFNFPPHIGRDSARVRASQANKVLAPKKFVVRKYGDEGYCCWRVE
jgi:hypothetical protein